jgi:aminoglycoside 6'-N-acetyltransferase
MDLPLETIRLILRPFRETDAQAFSDYRSDPQVALYQGWAAPYPLEQAVEFVAEMVAKNPGQPGQWYQIALERKEDSRLIGDCSFHLNEDGRQAEIGFTLASSAQGQGYAAEAVDCLLKALFGDLQLHRVFANVDPANTRSINLLTRLGFRDEGCFRQSMWLKGEWVDEQWYALLREEWLAARNRV